MGLTIDGDEGHHDDGCDCPVCSHIRSVIREDDEANSSPDAPDNSVPEQRRFLSDAFEGLFIGVVAVLLVMFGFWLHHMAYVKPMPAPPPDVISAQQVVVHYACNCASACSCEAGKCECYKGKKCSVGCDCKPAQGCHCAYNCACGPDGNCDCRPGKKCSNGCECKKKAQTLTSWNDKPSSAQPFESCPKCGNTFIYAAGAYGDRVGEHWIECWKCKWRPGK